MVRIILWSVITLHQLYGTYTLFSRHDNKWGGLVFLSAIFAGFFLMEAVQKYRGKQ